METVIRVMVVYVVVMAGLRLLGKRTFGQMSPADLVVLMLIPEFFQEAIAREDFSMTNALVAVSTLLLLVFFTDTLAYRFKQFGRVISGDSTTVVSHGHLRTKPMDKERLSSDDILEAVQRAGLERIDDVRWAVLHPDGTIAIVPSRGLANQRTSEKTHAV